MQKLIKLSTPDEVTTRIQEILDKADEAIVSVHDSRGLMEEKAIQLRDHELMVSDDGTLGHIKTGTGLKHNDLTNATDVDEEPINEKIKNHDVSEESHPDVRTKLEEIPVMINAPIISGPLTVKNGNEYAFTIEATPNFPGVTVAKLTVFMPDGRSYTKYGNAVVGGMATFALTFISALEEETQRIRVMAYDTNDIPSEASYLDVFVSSNEPPNLEYFTCTGLPAVMEPGTTVDIVLEGGTDANNDPLTYSIVVPGGSSLSFSKVAEMTDGETIQVSVANTATRGRSLAFTVKANDGKFMGESQKAFAVLTNSLPDMTAVTTTIPYYLNANTSIDVSIAGVVDESVVSMTIAANNPNVTFSKSSELNLNEIFTIDMGAEVAPGTDVTFTITAFDEFNVSSTKTQTCRVNSPPNVTALQCIYIDTVAPEGTYQVRAYGAIGSTDLTYRFTSDCPYVNFSKTSGIEENESVSYTVAAGAAGVRGRAYTLDVTAVDTRGGRTTKPYTFKINSLPTIAEATDMPVVLVPDDNTTFTLVGTDVDSGQAITFDLACDNEHVVFSDSTDIVNGTEIHVYPDASMQRGDKFVITVTVSDGLESAEYPFNLTVNRPPVVDAVSTTLPALINPGGSIPVSFTGATDPDSLTTEHLRYSVSSDNANVTFSKSTDILGGENITMNVGAGLTRGVPVTITVIVSDGNESTSKTFITTVNTLADTTLMEVAGLPAIIIPDGSYELSIDGAVDANTGQTLTYRISASDAKVFFSKSDNLAAGETFTMTTGAGITRGTTVVITASAYDGVEYVDKQMSVYVNTLPTVSAVACTIPPVLRANHTYTNMSLAGLSDTSDSQSLFMDLTTIDGITINPATDLMNNDTFTVTTGAITAGSEVEFTIAATDGLEIATGTFTRVMNIPPVVDAVTCTGLGDTEYGGAGINISFAGATEGTGEKRYHIENNNPTQLQFSSTADIGENATVVVTPVRVAEATEVSFTVTATDSLDDPSLDAVEFSFTIQPIVKTVRPQIVYPAVNTVVPNDKDDPATFEISLSSYSTYIELDDDPDTDA